MPTQHISVLPFTSGKKEKISPIKQSREETKEMLHPDSPTPRAAEEMDDTEGAGGGDGDAGSGDDVENYKHEDSGLNCSGDICRICHCEADTGLPLITPCNCAGSMKYVHQACLQKWIKSSDTKICELCKYEFMMFTKVKPFRQWEKLSMTSMEQRKITCSVTFHVIAITCVIWSLYVLIERTSQELQDGMLEWPFWTKLIVVVIGFTGGLIFMYVQCKMYIQLCRRWRVYNQVIFIQDSPPKQQIIQIEMVKCMSTDADSSEPMQINHVNGMTETATDTAPIFVNGTIETAIDSGMSMHVDDNHVNGITEMDRDTPDPVQIDSKTASAAVPLGESVYVPSQVCEDRVLDRQSTLVSDLRLIVTPPYDSNSAEVV